MESGPETENQEPKPQNTKRFSLKEDLPNAIVDNLFVVRYFPEPKTIMIICDRRTPIWWAGRKTDNAIQPAEIAAMRIDMQNKEQNTVFIGEEKDYSVRLRSDVNGYKSIVIKTTKPLRMNRPVGDLEAMKTIMSRHLKP